MKYICEHEREMYIFIVNFCDLNAHRDELNVEVFINAVTRTFSTQSTFFDATKRYVCGRDQARVDTDHTDFQRLGHSPDALDIARKEITGKADIRIVGHFEDFFFSVEFGKCRQGAERLFLGDLGIERDVAKNSGGKEATQSIQAGATHENAGTSINGIFDMLLNLGDRSVMNEWAMSSRMIKVAKSRPETADELRDVRAILQAISHLQGSHLVS